jgi:hypothetical protein
MGFFGLVGSFYTGFSDVQLLPHVCGIKSCRIFISYLGNPFKENMKGILITGSITG